MKDFLTTLALVIVILLVVVFLMAWLFTWRTIKTSMTLDSTNTGLLPLQFVNQSATINFTYKYE